jgi:hypothetical protein
LKLAPLCRKDIVQLELSAAKLATDVVKTILATWQEFSTTVQVNYLSDSLIVLRWIYCIGGPECIHAQHRLVKLQDVSESTQWQYVLTELNPADIASRGSTIP